MSEAPHFLQPVIQEEEVNPLHRWFKFFLLYERFTMRTHLSLFQIQQVFEIKTKPNRFYLWPPDTDIPFLGSIQGDEFKIAPNLGVYGRNFLVIKGDISKGMEDSLINISIRPPFFEIIFLAIWLGFLALAFLFLLVCWVFSIGEFGVPPAEALFFIIKMMLAGYGLFLGGFKFASFLAKRMLKRFFEAS